MADEAPVPRPRVPLHREIGFWLSASLVLLGIIFYLWWGFSFGVWIDNGVYAVVVTLVGFGLAGMWLVSPDPPVLAPSPKT